MSSSEPGWKRSARVVGMLVVVGFAIAWVASNVSWEDRWRTRDDAVGTLRADPPRLELRGGVERALTPEEQASLTRERGLRSALRDVAPQSVLLSLALMLLAMGVAGARWALVLRGLGERVERREAMRVVLEAQGVSMVLPGAVGGDLYRVAWLMARKVPALRATLSVAIDRLMGLAVFTAMVALAASQSDWWNRWPSLSIAPWVISAGLLLGGVVAMTLPLRWVPATLAETLTFVRRGVREEPGTLLSVIALSALNTTLHGLAVLLMLHAMSPVFPPLADAAVGVGVGMLANALPAAPAGIGVGEAAFVFVFKLLGLASADVIVALLLLRALNLLLALATAAAHLWRTRGAKADQSKPGRA